MCNVEDMRVGEKLPVIMEPQDRPSYPHAAPRETEVVTKQHGSLQQSQVLGTRSDLGFHLQINDRSR